MAGIKFVPAARSTQTFKKFGVHITERTPVVNDLINGKPDGEAGLDKRRKVLDVDGCPETVAELEKWGTAVLRLDCGGGSRLRVFRSLYASWPDCSMPTHQPCGDPGEHEETSSLSWKMYRCTCHVTFCTVTAVQTGIRSQPWLLSRDLFDI